MADVQAVRKAEQVEVTVTSPESAPAERVRIAGLEAILGNDVLAKLTAAADADGMLPLAQYTQIVSTPVHSRSIPIGQIESKFFGSKKAEIQKVLKEADADGDGQLAVEELMSVVRSDIMATQQAKREHKRVIVLSTVLGVVFLMLAGVIIGSAAAFKDTYVKKPSEQPVLAAGNGRTLATAESLESVPLVVAPVLSSAALQRAKTISMSYDSDVYWGERVRRTSTVAHVIEINATALQPVQNGADPSPAYCCHWLNLGCLKAPGAGPSAPPGSHASPAAMAPNGKPAPPPAAPLKMRRHYFPSTRRSSSSWWGAGPSGSSTDAPPLTTGSATSLPCARPTCLAPRSWWTRATPRAWSPVPQRRSKLRATPCRRSWSAAA